MRFSTALPRLKRMPALCLLWLGLAAVAGWAAPAGGGPAAGDGSWLVQVDASADATRLAAALGAQYDGPLRGVDGWHRMRFVQTLKSRPDDPGWREGVLRKLDAQPGITAHEEEVLLDLRPRSLVPADPLFPEQWHLENVGQGGGLPFADISVRGAWESGLTGRGVIVAIVDQGIEYDHPDLESNWLFGSGYDFRDNDTDASPEFSDESHGTAVAGITLAATNAIGGLGVAPEAGLVPVRLIGTRLSGYSIPSGATAEALAHGRETVAIYNNSWGPSSEGGARYSPVPLSVRTALAQGAQSGRGGRGSIYVWAAGNGGLSGHNANYDGYNTSIHTVSVGAVGDDDIKAGYSVPGANLLVAAPSGGRGRGILTTDNTGTSGPAGYAEGDVYDNFSGTSAAAPIVSGVVALMLQQRPQLLWHDVQQILALTAVPVDFEGGSWARNGAGYWVSHDYGFGRVDAAAAVRLAEVWPLLPGLQTATQSAVYSVLLPQGQTVSRSLAVDTSLRVQFVRLTVTLNHSNWGDLRVELVSPQGTRSVLAEPHGSASGNVGSWTYLSTRHLGELSEGEWIVRITDDGPNGSGSLSALTLEAVGTDPGLQSNRPPVGEDRLIETTTFPVEIDLLAGLSDPDGDPLEILSVQAPRAARLEDAGHGRVRFIMGNTATGLETFSVLVGDGRGGVKRCMIQVFDPRPVALNDVFPVAGGSATLLPVLDNDRDPNGQPLRLLSVEQPRGGATAIDGGRLISYTPPDGFKGVERFSYRMTDDRDGEASAWVTVVVQETPDIAVEFDGVDDFMRLPAEPELSLTNNFTAEAWIYPLDWGEYVTGFGRIFDRDSFVFFLNGFDHSFYNDRSLVAYFVLNDGSAVAANSSAGTLRLNEWQHVAVSFNSADAQPVRFYVNGLPVGLSYPINGTTAPARPLLDNRLKPLYMGEAPSGARAFKGRMTEFRIWDRVLSPQDVLSRRATRLSGGEPGLRLYFPLTDSLGPTAVSTGGVQAVAELSGARRVPRVSPWEVMESHYTLIADAGNGWWLERTLGWMYGDAYPWLYLASTGWAYSGQSARGLPYWLWPAGANWGWLQTTPALYPWFYRPAGGGWLRYLEGTTEPGLFYSFELPGWVFSVDPLPGF